MAGKPVKQQSLDQRVLGFIEDNRLTVRGQTLLVAVSGGQDSVCLLHLLHQLKPELGIKLHVAHLDHQLRGKESAGDARYVARLAKSLGIPPRLKNAMWQLIKNNTAFHWKKRHGRSGITF